ncbi:peroxisome biogenesis factor 10-like [Montipora capricornis]|uniref:peroxisome biogenesis factor 10-like n=1 Tax=Montipora capricornis TaxID=246305 RepID=UPI0035F1D5E3
MFARAGQPELIRANQKDSYYLGFLREGVGQICRNFLGPFCWIKWKTEIELLADLFYFGLTTISGFQTLGEEYCNIVQVDRSRTMVPSLLRRGSLILLYVFGPYIIEKTLSKLELCLRIPEFQCIRLPGRTREIILNFIPCLRTAILYTHRAHLALFYLTGVFYHVAKRLTGIQYLLVRQNLRNEGSRPTYRLLGYLSILQLCITILIALYQHTKSSKPSEHLVPSGSQTSLAGGSRPFGIKCALCLERLQGKTATPCGHLFCWNCITEWCSSKAECPLCREPVHMSRLVFLHHYEPT